VTTQTAVIATHTVESVPSEDDAPALTGGESTSVVWTRCPTCLRIWRPTQLSHVRIASGWRLGCPDWECVGEPPADPLPQLTGARLVAGQRLGDAW